MPATRYAPLVAYLAAYDGESVRLSFAEIEAILGAPLPASAQVAPSYWTNTHSLGFILRLCAMGWEAHLDIRAHAVTFTRIR